MPRAMPRISPPGDRPHVVVHVAVSVDGATTGFDPDLERFYALARTWAEDVTLVGADTILAQEDQLATAPLPGPTADGPLLAVVDGRRRVRRWRALRECGHWSDVVALRTWMTPARAGGESVRELVSGLERVDLAAALVALAERDGARTVRVDSGGALTGALLAAGLVDELSFLVHPWIARDGGDRRWHGPGRVPRLAFELTADEALGGGLVWLRYANRRAGTRAGARGGGSYAGFVAINQMTTA